MKIILMNTRLTALVTVMAIVAAAAVTQWMTPQRAAGVEAAQAVDARISDETLKVKGTRDADNLTLRLRAGDDDIVEVDAGDDGTAEFSFNRASFTEITINARGGNDVVRVDEANGPIIEPTSIRGGNGDDTILGGSAIETIYGGPGDDFIDGNRANDVAFMGAGDDTFRWDPGDASDVVEGEGGRDTLLFNGASGGDTADLSANGERFTFFRFQGNVTMDNNEVEVAVFNAFGGQDAITVNDLAGTGVTDVEVNLEPVVGSGVGDGIADRVIVNGTAGNDRIVVTGNGGSVNVAGLSATVAIDNAEFVNDRLDITTLAGNDSVDTSGLAAGVIQLVVD